MAALNSNNLPALIKRYACQASWLAKMANILSRLEAATSLLESIVSPNLGDLSTAANGTLSDDKGLGLAAVGGHAAQPRGNTPPTHPAEPLLPAIEDFDALISEDVQRYFIMSKAIGGLVAEQVGLKASLAFLC